MIEAIETLKGNGPKDLTLLTATLASQMLVLGRVCETIEDAQRQVKEAIESGAALKKLQEWVALQGGEQEAVLDYHLLPTACYKAEVTLNETGYVLEIDAEAVGKAALVLGAGRETKESCIDLGVGIVIHKKMGDEVNTGDAVATIYYNDETKRQTAETILVSAYKLTQEKVDEKPLIYDIIRV